MCPLGGYECDASRQKNRCLSHPSPYAHSTSTTCTTGGSVVFEGFMVLLGGVLASLLPDRWAKRIAARFPSRRRGRHASPDPTD